MNVKTNTCGCGCGMENFIFSSNGVTTMLTEAIQSATATHQNGGRYSLTSPVTARGEEKSLTRQAGEQE